MGFGDYLPNENVGIPRFLHIGRNPWLGDYASNDPSAINSRENTGLYPQSDRIALITHNSTGLYPSNGQFAVISHNLPGFPASSNARMGNHHKQTRQRIKSRHHPGYQHSYQQVPVGASRHHTAHQPTHASKHQHAPARARQHRPEPTSMPPSDQNPAPPAAWRSPSAHRPGVVQYCNTVCRAARAPDHGSG